MNNIFLKHFDQKGFEKQTLIQKEVAQPLRNGQSVLGLSPTGSGKTLAFALPLMESIIPQDGTQLIVLAPSQELAIQTTDVFREWASLIDLRVTSITGGANVKRQIERLKKKPEIIVGTPGRILTLMNDRRIKTSEVKSLVFDEADELLTGETLDDARQIEDQLKADTQLSFFSATNDLALDDLKLWFDVDPVVIDVRKQDHTQGQVQHGFIETNNAGKVKLLKQLSRVKKFQGLVFFNHVSTMEKVAAMLKHEGVSVGKIAGHQVQIDRASAMRRFKKKELSLLMVTDVAARGLDVDNLPAVINYDVPENITIYTHRVGRTGRMGRKGLVITFGNDHDIRNLRKITNTLHFELERLMIANRQVMTKKAFDQLPKVEKNIPKEVKKATKDNVHQEHIPSSKVKPKAITKPKNKGKKKHSKRKGMRKNHK